MKSNRKFLSVQELAKRWGVSAPTIYKYIKEGKLATVFDEDPYRIAIAHIEDIERTGLSPLSPIEKKRLEEKISNLEEKVELYESVFDSIDIAVLNGRQSIRDNRKEK